MIRVERVEGGEDRYLTPVTDDGIGTMFLQVGRNKRSLTLNPLKPEGQKIVRRLVATADIVVANLPPQTLESMGLDYETLQGIKPDIILATANAGVSWSIDETSVKGAGRWCYLYRAIDGKGPSSLRGGGRSATRMPPDASCAAWWTWPSVSPSVSRRTRIRRTAERSAGSWGERCGPDAIDT